MSSTSESLKPAEPRINAAVFASAGSGKTFLLVTRMLRLLLAGARPDGIFALTFTRKAAGEMRQRLYGRLQTLAMLDDDALDKALQDIGIAPDANTRQTARNLYEQVLFADSPLRISTFHAFCQDLLRRFPLEADIPAGYELLEKAGIVEIMAWDALFLEATRQPDSPQAQALEILFDICNGLPGTRESLVQGFLGHRSDWWAYTENQADPVVFASQKAKDFLQPRDNPLGDFFDETRIRDLREFQALLRKHDTATNLEHADLIDAGLDETSAPDRRFKNARAAFLTKALEPRQRKGSATLIKKLGEADVEKFLGLHQRLCDAILSTQDQLRRNETYRLNVAWYRAGQALLDIYQQIKTEQRLLDFADLEWKTYCLLRDPEHALWVQYKLDQKIDHLLIDEFQDTNPTQWQLILPLLKEIAAGEQERSRSVFLVGDTKQSIYGFRRANPQLQIIAGEWLKQNLNGQAFPLNRSWRSSPAIMSCLNAVFENTPLGTQLQHYEKHETWRTDLPGRVEILPLANGDTETEEPVENANIRLRDPLTEARPEDGNNAHYYEGLQIAARIRALIDSGCPVEKHGVCAPVNYDDICILLRSRTHAAEYERALEDSNIPFIGAATGELLDCLEVRDIEALLNILVTPFDNLALAQILRSPLFSANDEDLIQLASQKEPAAWYSRLAALVADGKASAALQRAHRLLSSWQPLAGQLPVHDLLDRIYHEGHVLRRYRQATPPVLQAQVNANLNVLLEMALAIDSGRYPGLSRFLNRLDELRESAPDQPDAPTAGDAYARVRFMTIHGAKGLEAPVVFLADSAATLQRRNSYRAMVGWPADSERPDYMLLSGNKDIQPVNMQQLIEQQQLIEEREQTNLLYVALSRAKQILIISGSATARSRKSEASGWYADILNALLPLSSEDETGRYFIDYQAANTVQMASVTPDAAAGPFAEKTTSRFILSAHNPATLPGDIISPSLASSSVRFSENTSILAHKRGEIIHKLLEWLSPPNPRTQFELEDFLHYGISIGDLQAWRQEGERVIQHKALGFLFDPEKYIAAYKEAPIAYRTGRGEIINGVIDRLVRLENEVWVVDYKTQANIDDALLPEFIAHYEAQLGYYAEGIKQLWPESRIRTALLLTNSATLIPLPGE